MKQHALDLHVRTPRVLPAAERLIFLLRAGPCSTWGIITRLKIRDVSGAVTRANYLLAESGLTVENLASPGEVGRYAICEDGNSSDK